MDTEYKDIETRVISHIQSDAWLGNTANVATSHRIPMPYLPYYRDDQVPAVSFAIEQESNEVHTAGHTVDRRIRGVLEIITAGGNADVLAPQARGIVTELRRRIADYGLVGLPVGSGMINGVAVLDGETAIGEAMDNRFYYRTSVGAEFILVDQGLTASGADPTPAGSDALSDVLSALKSILESDATIAAAVADVSVGPRVDHVVATLPRFPRITLLPGQLSDRQQETITDDLGQFPFTAIVEHRGHGRMTLDDATTLEDTVKQIVAGIRRVVRHEGMKSLPLAGLADELVNNTFDLFRPDTDDDPLAIEGITTGMAILPA